MSTLVEAIVPRRQGGASRVVYGAGLAVGGSLLVAGLAQVSIRLPFTPVPITGQTLGVLLVGASLGPALGAASLLLYLAEGAVGLPFFAAGGHGVSVLGLSSATGGYLWVRPGRGVDRMALPSRVGSVDPELDRRDVSRRGRPLRGRRALAHVLARRPPREGARIRSLPIRHRRHAEAARRGRAAPRGVEACPTGSSRLTQLRRRPSRLQSVRHA